MISNTSQLNRLICTIFLLSIVVFPNAFRYPKLAILVVLLVFIIPTIRKIEREPLILAALGVVVTLIYLAIGAQLHVDPSELLLQTVAAYIVAPIFWIFFANYYFGRFSARYLVNVLLVGGAMACFVTFLCFWLWEQGYTELYALINGSDKINAVRGEDGYGIILNLFGSLIFISAAIMSVYSGKLKISLVALTLLLLVVAFISGRTALLLSFVIGGVLLVFVLTRSKKKLILYSIIGVPIALGLITFIASYYGVNIYTILDSSIEEVLSGGGSIRSLQISYLIDGIDETSLFGAGHGANVTNLRFKGDRPWAYEVLFFATVFRVGAIGTLIYSLPLILSVTRYVKLVNSNRSIPEDHFLFFGLIAMSVSIFTNAYFEAIDFQWTYFIPYVYFLKRSRSLPDTSSSSKLSRENMRGSRRGVRSAS